MKRAVFGCAGAVLLVVLSIHASIAGEKAAFYEVTIDNFTFRSDSPTVPAGATVTWINHDDIPHTVVSTDKQTIVSPALDTNEKFSYTFTAAGTNDCYCSVHPHRNGRIVVRSAMSHTDV